jgi:hypothetical protein
MTKNIEEQAVFMLAEAHDGVPLLTVGIPEGAWKIMREGKTSTFDLTKAGLSLRLIIYGAEDHAAAMKVIEDSAKQQNIVIDDRRRTDFAINPGEKS